MPEELKPISESEFAFPPHIKDNQSIKKIMWLVVIALIPTNIYAAYLFGVSALVILLISVVSAAAAEALFQLLFKKPVTVSDGSAAITGLLIGMNMPHDIPLYIPAIGSFFAIIIVKQLFGGLGNNIFNPALSAKALLFFIWPVYVSPKIVNITTNADKYLPESMLNNFLPATIPFFSGIQVISGKITDLNGKICGLVNAKIALNSLLLGNISGCIGEISPVLLLIGGLFLIYKRIITWHIPVSYIGTFTLSILIFYGFSGFLPPVKAMLFHLSSGSLFLGALFMATDTVTSPVSAKGMIIFGIGCGIITSVIRLWSVFPEDVCFAILLMNATVPLLDIYSRPRIFGA